MEPLRPRLTSVMGVARALLSTIDVDDAVEVLVSEFGWDLSFQATANLRGDDAARAFGLLWSRLVTAPLDRDLGAAPRLWL